MISAAKKNKAKGYRVTRMWLLALASLYRLPDAPDYKTAPSFCPVNTARDCSQNLQMHGLTSLLSTATRFQLIPTDMRAGNFSTSKHILDVTKAKLILLISRQAINPETEVVGARNNDLFRKSESEKMMD